MRRKSVRAKIVRYQNDILPTGGYIPSENDKNLPGKTIFVEDFRNREISEAEMEKLRTALSERGESPDQIECVGVGGEPRWHMVWPRNLKWKSLPYVSDSQIAHMFSDQNIEVDSFAESRSPVDGDTDVSSSREDDDRLVAATRRVIVWNTWKDTPQLRGFLSIWDRRETPVHVSFFDGETLEDAADHYAIRLREVHEAEERFLWNYQLNFVLLCSRAMAKVASEFGDEKDTYARTAPRLDASHLWLCNPLALQIMYHLRREYDPTPFERRPYDAGEYYHLYKVKIDASPFSRYDFETDTYMIAVEGTGTYAPFVVQDLKLSGFKHNEVRVPTMFENYTLVLGWLSNFGYVYLDINDRYRLTPKGYRLLELIGPALDDPDVLLRWRDPDSGGWRRDSIPAIDRWINKTFRSVKRRVAHLPPAPVVERDVSDWMTTPEGRQVIYGFFKRIDKKMLEDETFRRAVESIDTASLSLPFQERRFGVLRDILTIDNDDVPIAFWVGIPIGIFSLYAVARETVGPLRDVEDLGREASRLREACENMLPGDWIMDDPRLWSVGRTGEDFTRYHERTTDLDSNAPLGSDEWKRWKDMRPQTLVITRQGYSAW